MKKIYKLEPFYSEKIWGYENWNLSTHKNGYSKIEGKEDALKDILGKDLPILIKIIQANEKLSVQVHPDDKYSNKFENDNGKTECWYILEAREGASLICGIEDGLDKEKLSYIINNGNIEKYLKRISVSPGDMIYIPSGTVHAIEDGIKLIEIQQSSDVTYRMYDWGRDREMHIEKSLDVIDYKCKNKSGKIENFKKLETPYFTVEKICIDKTYHDTVKSEFCSYTVIDGEGYIISGDEKVILKSEETVYIPSGVDYKIIGNLRLLKSSI
ncbi:MAG: type I phosphomannose isomerase catalytic subunit [Romboutsia sp.]